MFIRVHAYWANKPVLRISLEVKQRTPGCDCQTSQQVILGSQTQLKHEFTLAVFLDC